MVGGELTLEKDTELGSCLFEKGLTAAGPEAGAGRKPRAGGEPLTVGGEEVTLPDHQGRF